MIVGQMIPGFNDGLQQMQAGGLYTLTIPATLGYGDRQVGPIPANSDLRFDVDLIAVRSMEEIAGMMRAASAPVGPSVTMPTTAPPVTARPRR
jgi:FKBP-type peptidyl-prolyl cis-trans isomerase FkpA